MPLTGIVWGRARVGTGSSSSAPELALLRISSAAGGSSRSSATQL